MFSNKRNDKEIKFRFYSNPCKFTYKKDKLFSTFDQYEFKL